MSKRKKTSALLLTLVGLLLGMTASASPAAASPEWRFNGTLLPYQTTETVTAEASEVHLTIPGGMEITCKPAVFELEVKNLLGGPGVGEVVGVYMGSCSTSSSPCTVESAEGEGLPWPLHLTTIGGEHYLVIEDVEIGILFGNEECVLDEFLVTTEGAIGGLIDDSSHTATVDSTTMQAVGAQLRTFGLESEFEGTFSWFPTGANTGLELTVL